MKNEIIELLTGVLKDLGITDVIPEVDIPENPDYGEYTTNVAMRLTKILKKSPMDIALQVVERRQASSVKRQARETGS